ncbi:MAG: hypothetical protein HYW50_00405 [Candidatus Diapherotrites archaeon]|nr:hypothetical protein [Candidatus Diapherotrites archaeon]
MNLNKKMVEEIIEKKKFIAMHPRTGVTPAGFDKIEWWRDFFLANKNLQKEFGFEIKKTTPTHEGR